MANKRRDKQARGTSPENTSENALAGAVQESPRTSEEANASDPVASSGVAREEHDPPSSSGIPADDPDTGEARKKAYEKGATLVSRID
jgi:hypothetical protein